MVKKLGKIVAFVGAPCVGKTAAADALIKSRENFVRLITTTTRSAREGEKDGEHYHFRSKEYFEEMMKGPDYLEHEVNFGNYYGTTKSSVLQLREKSRCVVAVLGLGGAKAFKKAFEEDVLVIGLKAADKIMKERIMRRHWKSQEEIIQRVWDGRGEQEEILKWPHYIEGMVDNNGPFEETLKHILYFVDPFLQET